MLHPMKFLHLIIPLKNSTKELQLCVLTLKLFSLLLNNNSNAGKILLVNYFCVFGATFFNNK